MPRAALATILLLACLPAPAAERSAGEIVRDALNHWRGLSSRAQMTMVIHRPDWERSMSMDTYTQGEEQSLVRVTAPPKDRGNGTLIDGDNMWSFSPKVNRVIKVPSSMMNQGWMGSDFSNRDISRSDDIVDQYDHTLLGENVVDGHVVYEIESMPHEDAAVVWGREVLTIRDDNVMLGHRFYDQDGALVKTLETLDIAAMGGRYVAARQRMQKTDTPGAWTEVRIDAIEFDVELPARVFTLSYLRNPRD